MPHVENDAPQTLVTTAETAIAFLPSASVQAIPPGQAQPPTLPTVMSGVFNITPGAAATSVTVRVRQVLPSGALTGAVQSNANVHTVVAAAPQNIPFEAYDPVGSALGWVLTAQQGAATGNGTINTVSADTYPQ